MSGIVNFDHRNPNEMKFNHSIPSKLPLEATSIFAIMSELAIKHNAINLSQGFPNFPIADEMKVLIQQAVQNNHNQYAPLPGIPLLRERIVNKVHHLYGAQYHPDKEVNITAGATQALYTIITAMIHRNDEVIVFEPTYDSYVPTILSCGGVVRYVKTQAPDFSINWQEVAAQINPRTRMIIINSPHNPTGTILSKADIDALDKLTRNTNILVLSDEVYEHLVYDGAAHQSVCRNSNLAERSFVVGSFGKTFHATGWKVGFVLAPEDLMRHFRSIHQWVAYTVNTPAQYAIANYLDDEKNYLSLAPFYEKKRDLFLNLTANSRLQPLPSQGTYFQLMDYSAISNEPENDFAIRLTRDYGVAAIPVSAFYHDQYNQHLLRFCFAKTNDTLESAAKILNQI